MAETVKTTLTTMESKTKNANKFVKAKILPIWLGQKLDSWMKEVERLAKNK